MGNKSAKDIDFSLSDEEKDDLDQMIRAFNQGRKSSGDDSDGESLQNQIKTIQENFDQLGKVIVKINQRIDSLYEIIRLMHQKSEMMNDRIDDLRDSLS